MNVSKIQALRNYYSKYLTKNKGAKPSEEYKIQGIDKFTPQLEQDKITHFDYVIHGGDFDNLSVDQTSDPSCQTQSITNITSCLAALQNFNCPVLYIPGNHDPSCLFQSNPQKHKMLTGRSLNLHNSIVELQDDLVILGLGGSVPCYQIQQDGKIQQIWDPYPWKSEEQFQNKIRKLIKQAEDHYSIKISKGEINKLPQIIILTHSGPLSSSSTIQTNQCHSFKSQLKTKNKQRQGTFPASCAGVIASGSRTLDQIIINEQCKLNILANIHGHSHMAASSKMGRLMTSVIGPGSLGSGDFAELTLSKYNETSEWKIQLLQFINV